MQNRRNLMWGCCMCIGECTFLSYPFVIPAEAAALDDAPAASGTAGGRTTFHFFVYGGLL